MKKLMKRLAILALVAFLVTTGTFGQSPEKVRQLNVDSDALALEGYDPVAYFKNNKAIEGKSAITAVHEGVKYQFANQENKKTFISSPVRYLPQYGGWCAYAMGAKGEKVEVDPETFKVVEGKLYLFYNRFFNNTLDSWNKNESTLKTNADKNWSKLTTP
jgi:YHS domain-containing protein